MTETRADRGRNTASQSKRTATGRPSGPNLTYAMLDELGRAIVTGAFQDRAFPTEADLAKERGVSRSVTREAVKMLTAKGLLTARPRTGTSVQPPSKWNLFDADVLRWLLERKFSLELLRQFTELRIAIEPEAAALAADAADPHSFRAIESGYRQMVAAETGDEDPLEADIAFHIAILEASANPFYQQFRDLVETALRTSIRFTNRFNGRTASLPQHHAVLRAIGAGDRKAARLAMIDLIEDVRILVVGAERQG